MIRVAAIALCLAGTLLADVRISASDALRAAVSKPAPQYPAVAKQMKVSGHVEVEATVGVDGNVAEVKPVSGNPLLTPAAINAVKGWKFNPFTQDGQPAKAVVTLAFDFKP